MPVMSEKLESNQELTSNYIDEVISEGIWDWNTNTGTVTRSASWYRMLEYLPDNSATEKFNWENIIHPTDFSRMITVLEDYISGKTDQYQLEYRCLKGNGKYLWVKASAKIVERNKDGSVARIIGSHVDIQQQKLTQQALDKQNKILIEENFNLQNDVTQLNLELEKKQLQLQQQIEYSKNNANTDRLTGIYNRKKFENELAKEISRAERYEAPMSLAIDDVDHFKKINDSYGHEQGDLVLCGVADKISQEIRTTDIVARWGDQEFILILPETNLQKARLIAEKLRLAVAEISVEGVMSLSCSIGVTEFQYADNEDGLLKRLDIGLKDAKDKGCNRVSCVMPKKSS